jgi:hypothetical protein
VRALAAERPMKQFNAPQLREIAHVLATGRWWPAAPRATAPPK